MRQSGYYWVKFHGEWTVGEYEGNCVCPWQIIGSDQIFDDNAFEKIGGKINLPKDVEEDELSCYED